ncbi:hypothetical protein [Chryseobacterium terrae]|uniref:hypothetical protein n=1 Tax=Chryseobacterium terrae TaxID=3163299 RepID=UPI0038B4307B
METKKYRDSQLPKKLYPHFTLDILEGFGPCGFSLETPLGKTFKIHYRLFTLEEFQNLEEVRRSE